MLDLISQSYHRTNRERFIAAGRLVLAASSLLAIYLDPTTPARYENVAYALLVGYVVYAAALLLLLWHLPAPVYQIPTVTHVIDLAVFFTLAYFTEGPTSPFFLFFVFSLICATIRWQWPGTFWTGLVIVAGYVAMGFYTANVLHDPEFELNRFVVRSAYLTVIIALLGYLGHYRWQQQRELIDLAAWPTSLPIDERQLLRDLLEKSRATIGARRAILVWVTKNLGSCQAVSLANGEFEKFIELRFAPQSLVAEPLRPASFFCNGPLSPRPRLIYTTPDGVAVWKHPPLNQEFQARFAIDGAVLSSVVRGESLEGRVFFLGLHGMTADELVLAEIVAHMIATRMDNWELLNQVRRTVAKEERVFLSEALHATVLQSMAVTAMQMEMVGLLLQKDPAQAMQQLAKSQQQLTEGTRSLRSIVTKLTAPTGPARERKDAANNPSLGTDTAHEPVRH